jgi:hypothetical protein
VTTQLHSEDAKQCSSVGLVLTADRCVECFGSKRIGLRGVVTSAAEVADPLRVELSYLHIRVVDRTTEFLRTELGDNVRVVGTVKRIQKKIN